MTVPARGSRAARSALLVAVAVALLALVAWLVWPRPAVEPPTGGEVATTGEAATSEEDAAPGEAGAPGEDAAPGEAAATGEAAGPGTRSGLPSCDPASVPPEVDDVVTDIEGGGPYDHPRHDATTFHNREGLLPEEPGGYYREFTVETPGLDHRGARRVVTGGPEETDPEVWFFTDDHYESFCELAVP